MLRPLPIGVQHVDSIPTRGRLHKRLRQLKWLAGAVLLQAGTPWQYAPSRSGMGAAVHHVGRGQQHNSVHEAAAEHGFLADTGLSSYSDRCGMQPAARQLVLCLGSRHEAAWAYNPQQHHDRTSVITSTIACAMYAWRLRHVARVCARRHLMV
jgi:hypothetical protein